MSEPCRILVTGANGFVGNRLCSDLVNKGYKVRAAVRTPSECLRTGCEVFAMPEISAEVEFKGLFQDVDSIIHLAARVHVMRDKTSNPLEEFRKVNVIGTENLARAAVKRGVRRFVYVSSVKVNGEVTYGNEKFVEEKPASPQDAYGVSKWEAEQALHRIAAETGLEIVIVRPPLVYGPKVKGNFSQLLKAVAMGVPLPFATVNNLRSFIYVGNLSDALISCVEHPEATGQTYLVSDGEDISTTELLRQSGEAMGFPARLFSCPLILLRLLGRFSGNVKQIERLLGSLQIDSSKIRQELNWIPPYAFKQGLYLTIASEPN